MFSEILNGEFIAAMVTLKTFCTITRRKYFEENKKIKSSIGMAKH